MTVSEWESVLGIAAKIFGIVTGALTLITFLRKTMKKPLFPHVTAELRPVFYDKTYPDCAYLLLHVTPGYVEIPVIEVRAQGASLYPLTEKPAVFPVDPRNCRMPRDLSGFYTRGVPMRWDTSRESWAAFLIKSPDIDAEDFSRKIRLVGRWPLTGLTAVAKK